MKKVREFKKKINDEDYSRISILMIASFNVSENDKETLISDIGD